MLFNLTQKSGNTKVGKIATVTADRSTCPATCPHMGTCYPNKGRLAYWWKQMDQGTWGYSWDLFLKAFSELPFFTMVRYGQAGDLPSEVPGDDLVSEVMVKPWVKLIKARKAFGWLYTHKKNVLNVAIFKALTKAGITVNISCETMDQVRFWKDHGLHTVLTSEKLNPGKKAWRDGDFVIKQCPNQLNKGLTCDHCILCHERDLNHVVLFRANKGTKVNT